MMVIDTVHSSGVGRMHGGMKIARPVHSSQGPEAKLMLTPGMVTEKMDTSDLDSSSRPGLVIRRRIMVRQSDEADEAGDGRFRGLTPALSNQPNAATTTSVNPSLGKMHHSLKTNDIAVARSSSTSTTTQDDKSPPMTKPAKTLRLFDLNKLPTVQENVVSPASSPTSTIDSADSTTHFTTDHHHAASTSAMATRSSVFMVNTDAFFSSSSPSVKRFRDEGGALSVDLGLLAPTSETRRHSIEEKNQQFAFRKPQPVDYSGSRDLLTPARKRLRKLSEHAGTTSMAKSWTTGDGDGCNNRDVTKTLAAPSPAQADAKKVRRPDVVVDDEVLGAVAAILMMSSGNYNRRRDFPFPSNVGEASSAPSSTFADSHMDDEERRDPSSTDLAASDTEAPSRSLGSGSSVLLRPRNKQRYRFMTEIMVQTPILKLRRSG